MPLARAQLKPCSSDGPNLRCFLYYFAHSKNSLFLLRKYEDGRKNARGRWSLGKRAD